MKKNINGVQRAVQTLLKLSPNKFTLCCWCQCEIVWWQKLPPDSILTKFKGGSPPQTIVFIYEGEKREMPVATVDHLLERSNGGGNNLRNLVAACGKCNSARSNVRTLDYSYCWDCGRKKSGKSRQKRCKYCIEKNWLIYSPHSPWNQQETQ